MAKVITMLSQTELTSTQLSSAAGAAPLRQAAAAPQGKRLLFIDNLRILLISMVLVVHLDDTYGGIGSWYYHDPGNNLLTGALLSIPNAIGMASGMGLFFLIAGYFTPGPYDRKGPRSFLRDRLVRLGIPVLIYGLLLDPLVVYIAGGLHGSYWSFYANYLPQVRGVTGPAWFIALLLVFSLVYAAWRGLTRHRTQATDRTRKLPSYRAIFGFIFGLGLVTFVVRIWWPAGWIFLPLNVPVGYLPQYISLYILGLIAYRLNWFIEFTSKMGRNWSLIALIATLIILGGLVFPSVMMQEAQTAGTRQAGLAIAGGLNWLAFSYALWESFVVVGVCIGLLVLFRQRWNHQGRLAIGLAASVYTVYLIHPPVLVGFAYALHEVVLYPLLKWGIALLITVPLCFLISNLIRKIPFAKRVL
jgi:surface polysaccharide O-acyltransferase-like enzyme